MISGKAVLFAGIAIAVIIAVAAPFIASSNPDGLESAFLGISGAKEIQGSEIYEHQAAAAEEQAVSTTGNDFSYRSPFPDYSIGGLAKFGEAGAILAGTLLILGIAYGLTRLVRRVE